MWWVVLILAGIIVIYFIIQFIRSASPRGYARGIARTQLNCLKMLQKIKPGLSKEEKYATVILARPGYNPEDVLFIFNSAKDFTNNKRDLCFRDIVLNLIIYDYVNKVGGSILTDKDKKGNSVYDVFVKVVEEEIPENV